jgi:hypothetical protein
MICDEALPMLPAGIAAEVTIVTSYRENDSSPIPNGFLLNTPPRAVVKDLNPSDRMHFPSGSAPRSHTSVTSVGTLIVEPTVNADAARQPVIGSRVAASVACKLAYRCRRPSRHRSVAPTEHECRRLSGLCYLQQNPIS